MPKVQSKPGVRYDKSLKKRVSWWQHGEERFPRTLFQAGSRTKSGHSIDLHTGEVDVKEAAQRTVDHLLES